jgi:hypothetical protein
MKNPLKNRGQWIGLFCLTLSDISAAILIYDKKTGRIKPAVFGAQMPSPSQGIEDFTEVR